MRDVANTMDAHGWGTCANMIRSRLVERRQLSLEREAQVGQNANGWFVYTGPDEVIEGLDGFTAFLMRYTHNYARSGGLSFDDRRES
jgi:hypothetical protein